MTPTAITIAMIITADRYFEPPFRAGSSGA
jgi:hypothetical protein